MAHKGSKATLTAWGRADDMSSMHPTARRILKAAHDILEEKGFAALSFDAIARASGQYKGSITYYFGDKANLIAKLADSVGDGIMEQALTRLRALPSGPERIREAVATNEAVGRNLNGYRLFFDIIAQAARLEDVRRSMATLYVEYRSANRSMLVDSPEAWGEQVEELGTLSLAILDGLALQYMLDPDGFDPSPYWARWEAVLVGQLEVEAGGRKRS